jgi:hypothetical protein
MTETMNCFNYLQDNIPSWLSNLAALRKKIDDLDDAPPTSPTLRRKQSTASTKSLREKRSKEEDPFRPPVTTSAMPDNSLEPNGAPMQQQTANPAKRKRRSASLLSNHMSGVAKYRTRSRVVVWYDGEVQKSLELLVRNIGTGRNLIRKGKMAARLQALSAVADEEEGNDDDEDDDSLNNAAAMLAKIGYRPRIGLSPLRNTRTKFSINARTASSGGDESYDRADEALEKAQCLCERAAHQFLRDGDCRLEIDAANESFNRVLVLSEKELLKQKEPEEALLKNRQSSTTPTKMDVTVSIEIDGEEKIPQVLAPVRITAAT